MKKYMRVPNGGRYVVYVERSKAQKVLETGRVSCGDCYCSCADCDRCALRDGERSMHCIEITNDKSCYADITDRRFEVSDLIDKYYKPAPDIVLKDGDVVRAGKRIITIKSLKDHDLSSPDKPLYQIQWINEEGKAAGYCTYSLSTLKWNLIDEFKEIKVIDNIYN